VRARVVFALGWGVWSWKNGVGAERLRGMFLWGLLAVRPVAVPHGVLVRSVAAPLVLFVWSIIMGLGVGAKRLLAVGRRHGNIGCVVGVGQGA